ncbi:hypothetical protein EZV73_04080 [Acidaminobacter sp. JC074]|uniref:hypothetical protein n=1 Tax=Acidaminobacter sp. JC074 TaxID=2530199 RepID=UPI001F0F3AB1|nr:hypothetical protein [Acidaminobacter sp. JC074]MCH4886730.1 hypothetical protein [Acidaminobacter sp. JC074]
MEQKSIMSKRTKELLIQSIKEKKQWALLTLVVLVVTVIVLPLMMEHDISEEFIALGIFEIFVVMFVNLLIDFNYLHDSRKFGYYLSKPFGAVNKMHTVMLSNSIFALIFLGGLFIISAIGGLELMELFLVPIAWLAYLVFITALASHISGNTIIAGLVTIFIYGLPVLILGVIYYAVSFVSDLAVGFNVNIIMEFVLNNIYKLDVLYLIKYVDDFSIGYFVVVFLVLLIVYSLTRWIIQHRKNERIGEFIMFRGFKYFVAVIMSVMVPFIFSNMLNSNETLVMVLSFVILGVLTYYVALVILDKSFKIKKMAIKVLLIFMSIFLAIVLISGLVVTSVQGNTPDIDKIKGIYVSTSGSVYLPNAENEYVDVSRLDYEDIIKHDLPIYTSREAKQTIIDLHKAIVDDSSFNRYMDINIIYYMESGAKTSRYFSLEYRGESYNAEILKSIKALMKTDENKIIRFPLFYDPAYRSHFRDLDANIYGGDLDLELTSRQTDELIQMMRKDLDLYIGQYDDDIYSIGYNNSYVSFPYVEISQETKGYRDYLSVQFVNNKTRFQNYDIPEYFEHTRLYVQKLIDDGNN